ncbi:MAG: phospholipase, partial [Solirubrobacterales bacterium]|nr:phospholipase [Solirubrobacterales bacterium]
MSRLASAERASSGAPEALLVLHHGRGADERDLLALGDQLDPNRRLYVVAPR